MEVLFNETWCRLKWMDVLSNWESSSAVSSVAFFLLRATPALMLVPESILMHLNLQRHTNTLFFPDEDRPVPECQGVSCKYFSFPNWTKQTDPHDKGPVLKLLRWNQSCYFGTLTVDLFSRWRMKMCCNRDVTTSFQWASTTPFSWKTFWHFTATRCWYCSCRLNETYANTLHPLLLSNYSELVHQEKKTKKNTHNMKPLQRKRSQQGMWVVVVEHLCEEMLNSSLLLIFLLFNGAEA